MPRGGKLTIETSNEDVGDDFAKTHADVAPGAYVRLVVSDNGSGIPKEIQPNVFEPFFTTKEPGKGTGLGLATVYGIVKQSGGHIFLYSEVGHGTAFRIYFPRVDRPTEAGAPGPVPAIPRGTETVLVIEDETVLRAVTREILEDCGYTVLDAPNGPAGIEVAVTHEGPIHLLITDVIMPGLNGRETAARVARLRPNAKVLYVSGYTQDVILHHGVLPSEVVLLPKPYTAGVLARKVREVLDSKS
jgi:two-component system, cell cycle sensor histidine kinase and response regulator CckA